MISLSVISFVNIFSHSIGCFFFPLYYSKARDITLPTKVRLVKVMVFPVVMYGCESWTVKKAECWRIDVFELWCLRRLLRVPWTARRSNQSILKEISPGCSLEGMMLKLKLQYFGHLMQGVDQWKRVWCWEGLGAGGEREDRGWDGWMASPTRCTWVWVNSGRWWWTGRPGMLQFMGLQRVGHDWATGLNWTVQKLLNLIRFSLFLFTCTSFALRNLPKNTLLRVMSKSVPLTFSSFFYDFRSYF